VAPGTPRAIVGDPTRLRQVLVNLLANAIKFTERGSVAVSVERGREDALLFAVTDTGIGIPDTQLAAIFESFSQADASVTRRYGGTGLGLSISRQLVELMGGRLRVESEVGRGSTFSFTLPFVATELPAPAEPTTSKESMDVPPRPLRILLADDGADNVALVQAYVKSMPWRLEVAENGKEAVYKVTSEGPWDLVLMDMQMPVLDGYAATRAIRQWEVSHGAPATPIVALTAYALKQEIEKSLAAGCTAHLTKPMRKAALLSTVRTVTDDLRR
jgi:CheY-like chemotaxis protein/anti-sigma regulatory factor (Ser/Thr protein kinase)